MQSTYIRLQFLDVQNCWQLKQKHVSQTWNHRHDKTEVTKTFETQLKENVKTMRNNTSVFLYFCAELNRNGYVTGKKEHQNTFTYRSQAACGIVKLQMSELGEIEVVFHAFY